MNEVQLRVIENAKELSYLEWLRVSSAINRAFEEKERSARKSLKADAERIAHYAENG